jgi:hypothetical protein
MSKRDLYLTTLLEEAEAVVRKVQSHLGGYAVSKVASGSVTASPPASGTRVTIPAPSAPTSPTLAMPIPSAASVVAGQATPAGAQAGRRSIAAKVILWIVIIAVLIALVLVVVARAAAGPLVNGGTGFWQPDARSLSTSSPRVARPHAGARRAAFRGRLESSVAAKRHLSDKRAAPRHGGWQQFARTRGGLHPRRRRSGGRGSS